jgi:hypothetical protein
VTAKFGEGIGLLGYDLEIKDALDIVLYWESLEKVAASYDVFVHLLNTDGEIVAQADQKPLKGLAATDVWLPGDIIRDPVSIPLPADLQAGAYDLRVGVYSGESGERLSVQGGEVASDALFLDPVDFPKSSHNLTPTSQFPIISRLLRHNWKGKEYVGPRWTVGALR